jgi:Domain of unknown function (DUF4249)
MSRTYLIISFLLFFVAGSCVKEISYAPLNVSQRIVVSGILTNKAERQIVKLTLLGDYGNQSFTAVRDAQITLSDDLGRTWQYKEDTRTDTVHSYFLDGFVGVQGQSYSISITLPNRQVFVSKPQLMPATTPIDTFYVKGEMVEKVSETGVFYSTPQAAGYVESAIPTGSDPNLSLYWDVYQVWLFQEFAQQTFPPDLWQSCFITDYFNSQNVSLKRFSDFQAGASFRQRVGGTGLSNAFEHKTGWVVRQYTIDKPAAKYLEQSNLLITQDGSIFDVPPAEVRGNVYEKSNPTSLLLGYFQVASVSEKQFFVLNGSLGQDYTWNNSYCYPNSFNQETFLYCYQCHLLPSSSVVAPAWWK